MIGLLRKIRRVRELEAENSRLRCEVDYWHRSAQHWRELAERAAKS